MKQYGYSMHNEVGTFAEIIPQMFSHDCKQIKVKI